jgi:hypothetical protein
LTSLHSGEILPRINVSGKGGFVKRLVIIGAAALLAVSCGGVSPERKAVEQSYLDLVNALMAGDGHTVYNLSTENSRDFMDRLAVAMTDMGFGEMENGGDLFDMFLEEEEFGELSTVVSSVTVEGGSATLVSEGDTLQFRLEEGVWRVDVEQVFREGLEEGLEGSGLTVDDILEGNYPTDLLVDVPRDYSVGGGTAPVTIRNDLGSWDIHGVWIDPSSSPDWSEERLGPGYMLAVGSSFTVMVDPGIYDIMAVDQDGDSYTRWEVEVGPGGYSWSVNLADMD